MKTETFTPKELHDRIKRQAQPFPSLLQSAEDERRQARNALEIVEMAMRNARDQFDHVEQHGAAEEFSQWLDDR